MYLSSNKMAQIHLLLRRTTAESNATSYHEIDRALADIIEISPAQIRLNSQRYMDKIT